MSTSELQRIFEDIQRVDWAQLIHAYGRARDVPEMLQQLVSVDETERQAAWNGIWGSLNHQGDYYDSTVATIPFLVRFIGCPKTPGREQILDYLYNRFLEADSYGGDPFLEPPGGVDIPTPMRDPSAPVLSDEELGEPDYENPRSMELCAWQVGQAIRAGIPTYESLLKDSDKQIAGNAANLLLLWQESRELAKAHMRAAIDSATDAPTKAELLLKYGVYANPQDVEGFRYWTLPAEPLAVRVAACLCWCRIIDPEVVPDEVRRVLGDAAHPRCAVFREFNWVGAFQGGLWALPGNMAYIVPSLAMNEDHEVRYRAVQALMPGRAVESSLDRSQTCPILVETLSDSHQEIRVAAALALAEMGSEAQEHCPELVRHLLDALKDKAPSVCGHAARLLVEIVGSLTPKQKAEALDRIAAAAERFRDSKEYVVFHSLGILANSYLLNQREQLVAPREWTLPNLWQLYAFSDNDDCPLSSSEISEKLSTYFEEDPEATLDCAISTLLKTKDRKIVLGTAEWLTTIGPTAHRALSAIEHCSGDKFDPYVRDQLAEATRAILNSKDFENAYEPNCLAASSEIENLQILDREIKSGALSKWALWTSLLSSTEWLVRYETLELVRQARHMLTANTEKTTELRGLIRAQLHDDSSDEIRYVGRFRHLDKIYHWRRQRRSIRLAAIHALFALGINFEADELLDAMVYESMQRQIICGNLAIPGHFAPSEWKLACNALRGGAIAGELKLRAARREARNQRWAGQYDPTYYEMERNLSEAIAWISGRLKNNSDS